MYTQYTDSSRSRTGIDQAQKLMQEGLYQEAIGMFNRVLLRNASDRTALIGLGQCYLATGEIKYARKYVDQARESDPMHPDVVATFAGILIHEGRIQDAVGLLEDVAGDQRAGVRIHLILAEAYEKLGQLANALRSYEEVLDIDPSSQQGSDGLKRVFEQGLEKGLFKDDLERLKRIGFKHLRGNKRTLAMGIFQHAAKLSLHDTQMYLTMGHHLGDQEMYTQAIVGYHKVLEKKPDNADALTGLALAHAARGEIEQAVDCINRAIIEAPQRIELHVYRADIFLGIKNYEEAMRSYEAALDIDDRDAAVLFSLANLHAKIGNEMKALELYTRTVRINTSFSVAYLNLFHIHERRGGFLEASRYLSIYRQQCPDDIRGAVRTIGLLDSLNRHRQLLVAADNEMKRFGPHPDLMLNKSVGLMGLDDLNESKTLLKTILSKHPKYAGALNNLGVIAEREGKIDKARLYYEHAAKSDKSMAEPHYNLGCLLLKDEKFDEAAELFRKAIEIDTYLAHAYHNLGTCLRALDKHKEAKEILKRGLELAERISDSQMALGQSQLDTGEVEEALETFKELIEENPDYDQTLDLLMNLWRANRQKNDVEGAGRAVEAALMFSDNKSIEANLAMGITFQEAGKLNNAEQVYKKVLKLDPGNAHALMNLAIFYKDVRGDEGLAIKNGREALRCDPLSDLVRYNLAVLLYELKKPDEAMQEFKEALALNPNLYEANLALAELLSEKDTDAARNCLEQVVVTHPRVVVAWVNLGAILLKLNRIDEAIEALDHALSLDETHHIALYNKALGLDILGDSSDAIKNYVASKESKVTRETVFNLAELHDRLEEPARAKYHYYECVRKYPTFWEAKVNLARILRTEGQVDEPVDLLVEALTQSEENFDVLFNLSLTYMLLGQHEKATELVEILLDRDPFSAENHVLDSSLKLFLKDFEQAESSAEQAILQDPYLPLGFLYKGLALEGQERGQDAIESLLKVIDLDASITATYVILANVYHGLGDLERQEHYLERAREIDPFDPVLQINLAWARMDSGHYEEALEVLQSFSGLLSFRPKIMRGLGQCYFKLGQFDDAVRCFEEAISTKKPEPTLIFNYCLSLFRTGRFEDVLKRLDALKIDDLVVAERIAIHDLRAACFRSLEDPREARPLLDILALEPEHVTARINLASLWYILGQYDDAVETLSHPSVQTETSRYWILARIAENSGNIEEALDFYEDAALSDPGLPDAHLARGLLLRTLWDFQAEVSAYRDGLEAGADPILCRLCLGQAHLLKGQLRRGLRYLVRALKERDVNSPLRGTLLALIGSTRVSLQQYDEAFEPLMEARIHLGDHAALAFNLALASWAQGFMDEAREAMGMATFDAPFEGLYLLKSILAPEESALGPLEEGLAIFPESAGLHAALGNALVVRSKKSEAIEHYTKALVHGGESPPPFTITNLGHLITEGSEPLVALRALADMAGTSYRRFVMGLRGVPNHNNFDLISSDLDRFGPRFDPGWIHPPEDLDSFELEERPESKGGSDGPRTTLILDEDELSEYNPGAETMVEPVKLRTR